MIIINLEIQNSLNSNTLTLNNNQNSFLDSTLGKTINEAVDIGLRAILPDLIEEQVINIKDTLLTEGLNEGINTAIDSAVNFGKSVTDIITDNFENISQIKTAVEKGGLLDTVSESLDFVLNKINKSDILPNNITSLIKQGKNIILNNISNNIENTLTDQIEGIEKLDKYSNQWKNYYEQKDFNGMEKEYKKINKQLEKLIPLEQTLNSAREIENLHNLIKNNGQNFNLSNEQIELSKIL